MKRLLLLTLIISAPSSLIAKRKEYHAITNNEKITCALSLLDEIEIDNLFGSYKGSIETVWSDIVETITNNHLSTEYSLNPSSNNYMVLRVKIQNNTNQNIYIPPEEYLDGIQDALFSKYYISLFYKEKTSPFMMDVLSGAGFLGSASLIIFALYKALTNPRFFLFENLRNSGDAAATFFMCLLISAVLVTGIPQNYLSGLALRKKYKEIIESAKKYRLDENGEQSLVHPYSIANFLYKLPPGGILEDLIFVKKFAINDDFLKTEQIELIYSFEP